MKPRPSSKQSASPIFTARFAGWVGVHVSAACGPATSVVPSTGSHTSHGLGCRTMNLRWRSRYLRARNERRYSFAGRSPAEEGTTAGAEAPEEPIERLVTLKERV